MRDQDDAYAVELALDLGRLNHTAADDAWSTGSSMGFGHAMDTGQALLREPDSDLLPQLIL